MVMRRIIEIQIVLALACSLNTSAQQLPQSNLYEFNPFNLSPAYAGHNGCMEINVSHLSQWVGFEGAPTTDYFNINAPLGSKFGIGGSFSMDNVAFLRRTEGALAISYGFTIKEHHKLTFGVSANVLQTSVNASEAIVDDMTDNIVAMGQQRGMVFDAELGLVYSHKKFQLGLAVPQLLENSVSFSGINSGGYSNKRHMVLFTSYILKLNDQWQCTPSILFKDYKLISSQMDVNVMMCYNDRLNIGLGYRTNSGALGRLGYTIKDLVTVGYAYVVPGAGAASYSGGSHEIWVGVQICRIKKEEKDGEKPIAVQLVDSTLAAEEPADTSTVQPKGAEIKTDSVVVELPVDTTDLVEEPVADTSVFQPELREIEVDTIVEEVPVAEEVAETKEKEPTKVNSPTPEEREKDVAEAFSEMTAVEKDDFEKRITIRFDFNDTIIKNVYFPSLDNTIELLNKYPMLNARIEGHSCDIGTTEAKRLISTWRAEVIKKYLEGRGIDSDRIKMKAYLDKMPLVPNTHSNGNGKEKNRAINRRVVIQLE